MTKLAKCQIRAGGQQKLKKVVKTTRNTQTVPKIYYLVTQNGRTRLFE